jgi:hypothetical protein
MTWISFTRYYENTQDFNLISRTFAVAIPSLLRAMIGVAPVFMGYVFLGMSLFWQARDMFGEFSKAYFLLFCCQMGDSVSDIFVAIRDTRFIFGQVYVYSFTFIAICVFQNIFFVIVEDSYMSVKY